MSNKVRVSAISYLNTLPFLYGIYSNEDLLKEIDLTLDFPSACALKLIEDRADIGLVPVASLKRITNAYILDNFCISSTEAKSVMLFSEVPLAEIKQIMLDYQSMTSVNLVKILASNFWKINATYLSTSIGFEDKIQNNTAAVVIGDRALNLLGKYKFEFDLASEWNKFTSLPFVFALWVTNKKLDDYFLQLFNSALNLGVTNIDKSLTFFSSHLSNVNYNAKKYLTENINYQLTEEKKQSIALFLKFMNNNF